MLALGKVCVQLVPAQLQSDISSSKGLHQPVCRHSVEISCSKGLHQAAWRHLEQCCAD